MGLKKAPWREEVRTPSKQTNVRILQLIFTSNNVMVWRVVLLLGHREHIIKTRACSTNMCIHSEDALPVFGNCCWLKGYQVGQRGKWRGRLVYAGCETNLVKQNTFGV